MSKNRKRLITKLRPTKNFSFAISKEKKKKKENNHRSRWNSRNITVLQTQIFDADGEESVSTFNDPRKNKEKKEKKRRKRSSIPRFEESLICRKIFGERTCDTNPRSKSLVNDKRTCASTVPAEYSGLEDRNCVNHPLFSFHIQITLAKLRYLNHFVVSARIYQVNNSRRLEKKRTAVRNKDDLLKFREISNRSWDERMRGLITICHSRWNFNDQSQRSYIFIKHD